MKIKLFPSYKFKKNATFLKIFLQQNPDLHLSTSGTAALYQILKNNKIERLFIPNYICTSIDTATERAQVKVDLFEIDPVRMQPCLKSLQQNFASTPNSKKTAVLWPTYFGYTQNLQPTIDWCKQNQILFINDLAQSYGCRWNDIPLDQWGETMFFSFSPGKPTTAHLGGVFKSPHALPLPPGSSIYNFLIFGLFYVHRYWGVSIPGLIRKIYFLLFNKYYLLNQSISTFDQGVIGGVLERESLEFTRLKRQSLYQELFKIVSDKTSIKIPLLENLKDSNPYKFVLIMSNFSEFNKFSEKLRKHHVEFGTFYKPKKNSTSTTDNLYIIELPLLESRAHHEQLKKVLLKIT